MALPNPHLSEIPAEGLQLTCAAQPDELQLDPSDVRVHGDLTLMVEIAKVGSTVHVSGELSGAFIRQCVRCLVEFDEPARIPFSADYRGEEPPAKPQPKRAKPRSEEDDADAEAAAVEAEDIYPLVGERLELAEMLREQIILATPMQPLCREDCRGLCPICGQDLNERQCDCPEERQESPFTVLRKLTENRPNRPDA
ncbi:MAG: YceD family protein [Nitrospiraceae bacterium]